MATLLDVRRPRLIEQGAISFLYRPHPERQRFDELHDCQRLLLLLTPDESAFERLIAVCRMRPSRVNPRERFWGFVDMVLTSHDMTAALSGQVIASLRSGPRHVSAARVFAEGTYGIALHGDHSHLRWHVDEMARDPIAFEVRVERDADHLLTIANPDPASWGLEEAPDLKSELFDDLELHVDLPAAYPPSLQRRFHNRPFTHLDRTDWLDHPGAELMFSSRCPSA